MNRIEIKERAKELLGKNLFGSAWLMPLLVCFIQAAILSVASNIVSVASVFLAGPLAYGIYFIFVKIARVGAAVEIGDLFKGFNSEYMSNFLTGLLTGVYTFLWSLLFVIPAIVKYYSYAMAMYLRIDHPEYTAKQAIDESRRLMEGHKGDLFILDLSFIGWYFVGSLCMGVGTLWVVPYHQMARTLFFESIKNQGVIEVREVIAE